MKQQNFEKELPNGYRQVLCLNAKNAKVGIIFNLIAVAVCAVVVLCAVLVWKSFSKPPVIAVDYTTRLISNVIFIAAVIVYLVLHELVHGIAYKSLTGEKLTFGISWSCAFCGVPNIYTYRKTAIIASAAPLVVFSVIFMGLCAAMFFMNYWFFYLSAFLLGLHLGGCCGDVYMLILMAKYKNTKLLVRDTGPEQTLYLPDENA